MSALGMARTLADVLQAHADERPDKIAFATLDGRSVTFGAFNERVNRLNNAAAALGLRRGARVAILAKNRPEYIEGYGLSTSGLIVVPLNWRLAPAELAKLIAHCAPELLIVDESHRERVEALRARMPGVKHWVLIGAARPGWLDYEGLIASASAAEPVSFALPQDVLCLIYTSGTTGDPKGVAITHRAALGNARTAATQMLGLDEHDKTMAVMPLFHVGGMWYHLFPSFATGCTTLVLSEFEPGVVLRALEAGRISNVHLVPTMIGALLAHPDAARVDLRCVRLMFYAASSIPADLLRRAMQMFPHCGFAQAYGSTEAGVVTVLGPQDHQRARAPEGEHLLRSCGRPFEGHEVRLVDDARRSVDRGAVGEIEVRSANIMQGYWLDDERTGRVLGGGWLKTGDLGSFDDQGYLYIVDRKDDMVVTGGENVFPTEVEGCLYRDPDVLEAAVFGIPDPDWVERVVAAVVLKPGVQVSAEALIGRLRSQLAAYKCPKAIYFTSTLPKSAVGKILRKDLRKHYAARPENQP